LEDEIHLRLLKTGLRFLASSGQSDKHLLEQPTLKGLGLGDLGGDGFDLAVDSGKKIGDLGLFVNCREDYWNTVYVLLLDVWKSRSNSQGHYPA
jgi:hypothetical protein